MVLSANRQPPSDHVGGHPSPDDARGPDSMTVSGTALAFSGLGAAALATSVLGLRRRLQLSRAKHRSLAGHSRMARQMARFVPFYDYDERRFFCSDGAGPEIATQRRDGFMRLAAHFTEK